MANAETGYFYFSTEALLLTCNPDLGSIDFAVHQKETKHVHDTQGVQKT